MSNDDLYKPLFDAVVGFRDSLQRVGQLSVWYHEYKPTRGPKGGLGMVEFTFYFKIAETRMRGDVEVVIDDLPERDEWDLKIIETILDNLHWQTDPQHPWYAHNADKVEKLNKYKSYYEEREASLKSTD